MAEDNYPIPSLPLWQNAQRVSGALCFAGTRVPVESLFTNIEGGVNLDEYLDAFEGVTRAQAVAVLEHAKQGILRDAA